MTNLSENGSQSETSLLLPPSEEKRPPSSHSPSRPRAPPLPSTSPPSNRRVLRHLLIAVLLFMTAVAMTIPVRPILILNATNRNASSASYFTGFVDCLQALLSIVTAPLFGAVSDVIGRKPVLVLSHIGELVGLLVVARFPHSLVMQFPAYLVIALTNTYVTTANTIIADVSYEQHDGQMSSSTANYGYLGAVFGFCFLVGPALGGLVEDRFYIASSFYAASFIVVIAMIYVTIFLPETKAPSIIDQPEQINMSSQNWFQSSISNTVATATRLGDAVRGTDINPIPRVRRFFLCNEALTWIAVAIALTSVAQSGLNSVMFLYTNVKLGWETKETGFFFSMVGLTMLISQGLLAPMSVKYLGEVPTILLGYSLTAIHYYVYALAQNSATVFVGLFISMFGYTAEPAMKGLLARQVPIDCQGSLQGSLSALTTVVRPFSPILSAALFGFGTSIGKPELPFVVMAGTSVLAVGCARIAFWKPGLK